MSRISFNQINSLPDLLDQVGFELIIGTLPLAGSTRDLTIKCQQAMMPGYGNESWEALLHGHVIKFRGRKTFPRTLSINFLEDSNLGTYRTLKRWDEYIAGSETGNSGGFKRDYAVDARLIIYNTVGDVAGELIYENFFIGEVSDVQLDGSSSTGVQISATFNYDRMVDPVVGLR